MSLEWNTIGTVFGIGWTIVIGVVVLSNIFLKLYIGKTVADQNLFIVKGREQMMAEIRDQFSQKEFMDRIIKDLETRIGHLEKMVEDRH